MSALPQKHKISDIAEILRGVSFGSSEGQDNPLKDHLPVLRAGNIQERLILDSDLVWVPAARINKNQLIKQHDIIMCTSSGSASVVGKCAPAESDWQGSFGAFCVGIRPNKQKCNPSYLLHYLRSPAFTRWSSLSTGINIKNIRKSELEDFKVPLPPLAEQRRIADILDKADAIWRKRQESIRLTEEFLHSVFLDMFGDPVTNPKGWPIDAFGGVIDFITSGSRGWAQHYSESGASFLRIQNVGRNKLMLEDIAHVSPPENAEAKRTKAKPGDILLSITADLGRSAVIPEDFGEAYINQHLALLRVRKVEPLYCSAFIASEGGQRQIAVLNKGGVKAGLNFNDIRSLQIPCPPDKMQKKWALIYQKQCKNIERLRQANTTKEDFFQSLVQRAFRGEL